MIKNILIVIALIMLPFSAMAANPNLAGDNSIHIIKGTESNIALYGTANYVKPNPVASASVTNVATTTLTVVTPLTNRSRLIVMFNDIDKTKAAYLMLGSNTVTDGTGIRIDSTNNIVDVEAGTGVLASVISSGAAQLAIVQLARP
jgi:hypothetical protein